MTSIAIYNTLTRSKEPLQTVQPGQVGIYLCGPTVYKPSHIGHMVGPVIFDAIKRYLVYNGFQVRWVVNITDVDDKLIHESQQRGIPMSELADEMTAEYLANLAALGVDQIDDLPRATGHIDEIIEFTSQLIEKGFAYEVDGDVFFDVAANNDYGKLSNRSAADQQGEGGEAAARKRSPSDFALWKAARPKEPSWPSPWGEGRPGWHIECSAMSRSMLGETFDIHGGGLDLIFPHHENELAQSECCHGQPMARYWMHNGLMRMAEAGKVGGREEQPQDESTQAATAAKISRSKGAGGLQDLIARQGGETLRFFLLRTHYRSTIVFNEQEVSAAGVSLESFYRFFERFQRIRDEDFFQLSPASNRNDSQPAGENDPLLAEVHACRDRFLGWMDDDFNTGAAISELFDLLRLLNRFCDKQQLEDPENRQQQDLLSLQAAATVLRELSSLLGLFLQPVSSAADDDQWLDKLLQLFIQLRAECRDNKDFAMADQIRDRLAELGISLEDRQGETEWRIN